MIDQQKDGTTRPDGRQERRKKKKREQRHRARKAKQAFLRPAGWQGRHKRPEGRQRWRGKDDNNDHKRAKQVSLKTKQTRTQDYAEMQRCRVRGHHRLGMEQGNTAKNRDWYYACMGVTPAPRTMHPEDAYSLGIFLQSAWPDTHLRTAPRGCVYTG